MTVFCGLPLIADEIRKPRKVEGKNATINGEKLEVSNMVDSLCCVYVIRSMCLCVCDPLSTSPTFVCCIDSSDSAKVYVCVSKHTFSSHIAMMVEKR